MSEQNSAQNFLKALNSKGVQTSLKSLDSAMGHVEKGGKTKAFLTLNQAIQSMVNFALNATGLDIALKPFNLLISSIKAGTTQTTMELYREVLDLVQTSEAQDAAKEITVLLNALVSENLVEATQQTVLAMQNLTDIIGPLGAETGVINAFVDGLILIDEKLWLLNKALEGVGKMILPLIELGERAQAVGVKQTFIELNVSILSLLGLIKEETNRFTEEQRAIAAATQSGSYGQGETAIYLPNAPGEL